MALIANNKEVEYPLKPLIEALIGPEDNSAIEHYLGKEIERINYYVNLRRGPLGQYPIPSISDKDLEFSLYVGDDGLPVLTKEDGHEAIRFVLYELEPVSANDVRTSIEEFVKRALCDVSSLKLPSDGRFSIQTDFSLWPTQALIDAIMASLGHRSGISIPHIDRNENMGDTKKRVMDALTAEQWCEIMSLDVMGFPGLNWQVHCGRPGTDPTNG